MPTDPARIKQLGDLGEHFLEGLCIGENLSKSKPGRDENGWDYFIEMPQNRIPAIHLDAQPAPVKFLCQVKATDDFEDMKLSMKVSNWEHLSKTPLPAFVLILDYRGQRQPQVKYLCHIDQSRMAQTLKRMRELEAVGSTDLHKHEMTLTANASEEVDLSEPTDFMREVRKYTGFDLSAYVNKKTEWLSTLGYETGRYKFKFKTDVDIGDLVDAALNATPFKIAEATIASSRFGIDIDLEKFTSGTISIEPTPIGDCRVTASSRKGGGKAAITGQVIAPLFPGLTLSETKIKVIGTFFQAVIVPPTCNISFSIDHRIPHDLDDAISSLEFICMCFNSDAKIQFMKSGNAITTINVGGAFQRDPIFAALRQRLKLLRQFLDKLGHRGPFQVIPKDVFDQEQDMRWIGLAVSPKKQTVTSSLETNSSINDTSTGLFASPVLFETNGMNVVAFCYWKAVIDVQETKVSSTVSKCRIWDSMITDSLGDDEFQSMYEEFEAFCKDASKGSLIFQPVVRSSE